MPEYAFQPPGIGILAADVFDAPYPVSHMRGGGPFATDLLAASRGTWARPKRDWSAQKSQRLPSAASEECAQKRPGVSR